MAEIKQLNSGTSKQDESFNGSVGISIDEIQQWLGELQMQIKIRDGVINKQKLEIKKLQDELKKGG